MKSILIYIIRAYQKYISPLFAPKCRYYPSCSNYMYQAVEKHGAFKGFLMGIARILRCNPLFASGDDPVPNHFTFKRQQPIK